MVSTKRKASIATEIVKTIRKKHQLYDQTNELCPKLEETVEKLSEIPIIDEQKPILNQWHSLPMPDGEQLSLRLTLTSGQSFRWQETSPQHWSCVLDHRLYTLRQEEELAPIFYRVQSSKAINKEETEENKQAVSTLISHLRLDVALTERLSQWSACDATFAACIARSAATTTGVRILRLTPAEALISFICSSNNHVGRISSMVQRLCLELGTYHGTVDDIPIHAFPQLADLAPASIESKLRQWGFGYRARFIRETAQHIIDKQPKGEDWLDTISQLSYAEAKAALIKLPGVGPKVADCICLFGLDMPEAVPVDTHLWRIAQRDYGLGRQRQLTKTLTAREYDAVGDCLRRHFGMEAGWAHSFLFTSELRKNGKSKGQ
ncbi:DNA glycosylase [Syncephalis fuscata]|nr:DNA glycosylase [Syncephalis fuscata]